MPKYTPAAEEVSPETFQPRDLVRSLRTLLDAGRKRKRTIEALRDGNERLGLVVETAYDAFVAIDAAGKIIEWNPQAERTFGWKRDQILGRALAETIIPPLLREAHRKGLAHFFATGEGPVFNKRLELTALDRSGREFPVELTISPVRLRGSWVFYAFLRDITERKRMEQGVAHLAAIVESSHDSIISTNLDGSIISWNAAAEKIYGYSSAEVKGRPVSILFPPDRQDELREFLETIKGGESIQNHDTVRLGKGGERIDVSVTLSPIKDAAGKVIGASGIASDIRERKRIERRLRESEALFRTMVSTVGDYSIMLLDPTGHIVTWNTGVERLKGYRAEEIIGQHISCVYPPEDIERGKPDAVLKVVAKEGRFEEEAWRVCKDGSRFWAKVMITAARDEAGQLYGYVEEVQDIMERKQAEEKVHGLLESAPDAMIIVNETGEIVLVNSQTEKLFGFKRAELFGKRVEALVPELLRAQHQGGRTDLFANPRVQRVGAGFDLYGLRQDGSEFPIAVRLSPIETEQGTLIIAGIRDITERKQTEAGMRESGERLWTLSRRLLEVQETERRALARELHDEIGQALSALKINLQGMMRVTEPSAQARYLEDSVDIVEHTLQQVRSLSLDLRPSLLDDLGLVPALRWYLDRQAQRAGFVARLVTDPSETRLPAHLETACFRVAQEAITNVVRHARAPRVDVELRRSDGALQLTVRDEGVGFDVRTAQAHAARGNSLGLISMQERVHLASGTIDIESAPGHGTQIRARFPL